MRRLLIYSMVILIFGSCESSLTEEKFSNKKTSTEIIQEIKKTNEKSVRYKKLPLSLNSNGEGVPTFVGPKGDTIFIPKPGDTLTLFKKYIIPKKEIDFKKWLSQFNKLSTSKRVDSVPDDTDWKGPTINITDHYANGIFVDYFVGYEFCYVKVKLPFIDRPTATALFKKIDLSDYNFGSQDISFTNYDYSFTNKDYPDATFGIIAEFGYSY